MQDGLRTTTFTLTSGVECEVAEFTGLHQRILTEQTHKQLGDNLIEMLVHTIVRVGEITKPDITEAFVVSMLSSDRKHILVQARQFTMDFEEKFTFKYPYTDSNNIKQEHELEIDLKDGVFGFKPTKQQCKTYAEVLAAKQIVIELPKSNKKVRYTLLDGDGERIANNIKKKNRSSHTAILMRNPQYLEVRGAAGNEMPIKIENSDLDKMAIKDIEFLRTSIKENEGQVDTEIMFEHPEADKLPKNEKEVTIDLLGQVAFFFPSEAI